jgi:type II secretory pathway component PulF
MEFLYKGLDSSGSPLKATIEASTIEEAKKKLKAQGILFSTLTPHEESFLGSSPPLGTKPSPHKCSPP